MLRLRYEPPGAFIDIEIDLLTGERDYHRDAVERRVATHLPDLDIEVDVLACEELVLHKLLAGRIIDRADVAALLRANREGLDLDYLASWSNKLGLSDRLLEAWSEGLPEMPFPHTGGGPDGMLLGYSLSLLQGNMTWHRGACFPEARGSKRSHGPEKGNQPPCWAFIPWAETQVQ